MDTNSLQKFKELVGRRPVFGPFCKTSDPGIVEVLGRAGFDFVIINMEHGPIILRRSNTLSVLPK